MHDAIRNTVSYVTSSLLLFFISTGAQSALVPDYYSEPGINPHRDYVDQHFSEYIDPFTGKLQLHYVDLYIPGNNGMDLKVQRSYTSLDDELTDQDPQSIMGFGWTVHYGRMKRVKTVTCSGNDTATSNDNPVLQLPDGKEEVFYYRLNSNLSGGAEYVSKNNWIAECTGGSYDPADSWTVKSPDGRVYAMAKKIQPSGDLAYWYTTTLTDSANNRITVKYKGDNEDLYHNYNQKPFISSVTGQGATIRFTYTNDQYSDGRDYQHMRLRTVSANSQTVTYGYDQVGSSTDWRLTSVNLPGASNVSGSWRYRYFINESNLYDSTRGRFSIREVQHPKGGEINYTYTHNYFDSSSGIRTTSIRTKTSSGPDVNGGTWRYSYQKSSNSNDFDTTTIVAPDGTYTYKHYGADGASNGEVWRIGLLSQKRITGNGGNQSEEYVWSRRTISNENHVGSRGLTDNSIFAPILDEKVITRDGSRFEKDYQSFTLFGNPRTIVETGSPGNVSKTTNYTYFNSTAKWIVDRVKNETVLNAATVDGVAVDSTIARTFYSSGSKTGKLNALNVNGVTTTYDYHGTGDLYTETDGRSNTTYYRDYYRGIARDVDYADATETQRSVNNTGTVEWVRNGRGITSHYTYDALNRLASVNLPNPKTDVSVSRPTIRNRVVTRGGYSESAVFDGFGNVISITKRDPAQGISIVTTAQYDALNRLVFESYPDSSIGTRYTYDVLGRTRNVYHQASSQNTGQASKTYEYLSGNRVGVTDERNNITYYTYRAYGGPDQNALTKIEAPEGITVDIARNRLDMVDAITVAGKTRRYHYDSRLLLKSMSDPETGVTAYTRDAVGNLKTRRVGGSGDTCYSHDSRNRIEKIYFPPADCAQLPTTSDIQYVYDQNGNKTQVINHTDGITREFSYDVTDNLDLSTLTIGTQSLSVDYQINSLDHVDSIVYPSGRTVDYHPDALGRPTSAGAYASNVQHHPNGLLKQIEFANSVITTSTLTPRQRTNALETKGLNNVTLAGWDYDYDDLGNIAYITDLHDATYNIDPAYDAVNRLSSIVGPWGGTHATNQIVYDRRGNIEQKTIGSVALTYAYNPTSDQLVSVSGSTTRNYLYDNYGNIRSDGSKTYSYNHNNVLAQVTGSGLSVGYRYDGDKRMVKATQNGRVTYFFYDTADKLLGEYDSALNLRKEYVYLGSRLIATIANVPDIPASIDVSTPDGSGNHRVSWGEVSGDVTHYELVQSTDPSAPEAGSVVYSGTALSYNLSASNGTYYYFVRACNGSECGDYRSNSSDCAVIGSNSAPCMPASVSVPTGSDTGAYSVNWAVSEAAVSAYQIQESRHANFSTINQSYSSTSPPLSISGKGDGTYYYRVRACNGSHCSPYASADNGVRVLVLPDAPENLTVPVQVAGSDYSVRWSAASGTITAYRLYEATNSGFSGETLVYQGTARSYAVSGKTADATYFYRVVACNQEVCSNPTVAANPATVRHAPSVPPSLTVPLANTSGNYTVTWESATGRVTRYELQEASDSAFNHPETLYSGQGLNADISAKIDGSYHYRLRACNDFACSGYRVAPNTMVVTNSPYTAALIAIVTGLLL
jgi:hypothetical protein